MSSLMNFGEIRDFSSRAFWDDLDEEEGDVSSAHKKLQLNFQANINITELQIDILVLIEGTKILDFVKKTILKESKLICTINKTKVLVYKLLNKQNIVVTVVEENLSISGEVSELLIPLAKIANNLFTLTIRPKQEYSSEKFSSFEDKITFVRAINSSTIKELETPNFISGVAAGISSWRECHNLPLQSYMVYTDKVELDTLSSEPILKLLQNIGLNCHSKYSPKHKDQSHLYI